MKLRRLVIDSRSPGKGYEEIKDHLPANIEVACHNAANSCTLSGPAEDIEAYVRKLKSDGVFAKSVNAVSYTHLTLPTIYSV